jgi:hypothetical protein
VPGAAAAEEEEVEEGTKEEDEAPLEGRVLDPLPLVLLLFKLCSRVVCFPVLVLAFFFAAAIAAAAAAVTDGIADGGEEGTGGLFTAGALGLLLDLASFASPSESVRAGLLPLPLSLLLLLLLLELELRSFLLTESALASGAAVAVLLSSAVRSIGSLASVSPVLIASLPRF